jgi:Uma2 family endonuclease
MSARHRMLKWSGPTIDARRGAMTAQIDLPTDGIITRADFEGLPTPGRGWAWELRSGRLELTHMPVTVWHWQVVLAVLEYFRRLGHQIAGEQYVADSGFVQGGTGKNNFVADGVAFVSGHRPEPRRSTHEAAVIHAIVEAVSEGSEERDAIEKLQVYAALGVPHYWIIRGDAEAQEIDGLVTMYDLVDGEYRISGHKMVSGLAGV